MDRLHLLQLDPVPVVMRTQYLPLFSRLGAYRSELLDEVAYRPHRGRYPWFEAWSHEASLLPVEMEPWLRFMKQRAREGETWGRYFETVLEDPAYLDRVRDEIKSRGPLAAGELSDPRPNQGDWWSNRSTGARALDWLFRTGELGIRRRAGFVKEFDLLERIVPSEVLGRPTPTFEASLDELLQRSARAHGIASADCLVDYFRLPVKPAKARLAALVEDGRLVEAEVEGGSPGPISIRRRAVRGRSGRLRCFRPSIRRLVSQADRRALRLRLSDRDLRSEGEASLGLLRATAADGRRLVARFDLKTDREARVLEVRAAHLEEGEEPVLVAERQRASSRSSPASWAPIACASVARETARTLSTALRSSGSRD